MIVVVMGVVLVYGNGVCVMILMDTAKVINFGACIIYISLSI